MANNNQSQRPSISRQHITELAGLPSLLLPLTHKLFSLLFSLNPSPDPLHLELSVQDLSLLLSLFSPPDSCTVPSSNTFLPLAVFLWRALTCTVKISKTHQRRQLKGKSRIYEKKYLKGKRDKGTKDCYGIVSQHKGQEIPQTEDRTRLG